MELKVVISDLHSQLLLTRSIFRLIQSSEFQEAYSKSSDSERVLVKKLIESRNQSAIESWIVSQIEKSKDYPSLSVKKLRLICQQLGVPGYQYLPKSSLLSALRNREMRKRESIGNSA